MEEKIWSKVTSMNPQELEDSDKLSVVLTGKRHFPLISAPEVISFSEVIFVPEVIPIPEVISVPEVISIPDVISIPGNFSVTGFELTLRRKMAHYVITYYCPAGEARQTNLVSFFSVWPPIFVCFLTQTFQACL